MKKGVFVAALLIGGCFAVRAEEPPRRQKWILSLEINKKDPDSYFSHPSPVGRRAVGDYFDNSSAGQGLKATYLYRNGRVFELGSSLGYTMGIKNTQNTTGYDFFLGSLRYKSESKSSLYRLLPLDLGWKAHFMKAAAVRFNLAGGVALGQSKFSESKYNAAGALLQSRSSSEFVTVYDAEGGISFLFEGRRTAFEVGARYSYYSPLELSSLQTDSSLTWAPMTFFVAFRL